MSPSIMYILMGVLILGAVIIAASARRRPVDQSYRKNKLAHDLKWLKIGIDEVERRLQSAKKCACNLEAARNLEKVKQYHGRADAAVKGIAEGTNHDILAAESELTANQQLLANARAHLERAEHEQCDIPEDGRKGGCRADE
ncbi:MAG: hypothetical protein K2Y39_16005 [Candidatus Obscuribacterales bacterium]|nr:hypothetical protein [Candidatus Obscuribacterales bacterium]